MKYLKSFREYFRLKLMELQSFREIVVSVSVSLYAQSMVLVGLEGMMGCLVF